MKKNFSRAIGRSTRISGSFLLASAMMITILSGQAWSFSYNSNHPPVTTLTAGRQVVQEYALNGNTWVYLVYLPFAYDNQPNRKWPMIFNQPCEGATSNGAFSNMYSGNCSGLSGYLQTPESYHFISDSFIVVSPWVAINDFYTCQAANVIEPNYRQYFPPLFAHLASTIRIDTMRINFMGNCYGGNVEYKMATMFPNIPASISLWGLNVYPADKNCVDPAIACLLPKIPINITHGIGDAYNAWQSVKAVADAIVNCGNTRVTWRLVDINLHEVWKWGPYNDQDTMWYTWMLAQKKAASTSVASDFSGLRSKGLYFDKVFSGISMAEKDQIEVLDLQGRILSKETGADITRNARSMGHGLRILKVTRAHGTVFVDKKISSQQIVFTKSQK